MARPKIARRLPVADRSWRARGEIKHKAFVILKKGNRNGR